MALQGSFTDEVSSEQKYERKRGEVVEFWMFF